ncbi:MAG: DegQ family serine endoprotease [Planctomycetaceae bacterium]
MRSSRKSAICVAASVAVMLALGIAWIQLGEHRALSANAVAVDPEGVKYADSLSAAFRSAAKELRPAVVSVRSTRTIKSARRKLKRPSLPPEFRRFFEDDLFDRYFDRLPDRSFRQQGQGSGVIVSRSGYIVTNNHVVRNADVVEVVLNDKRTFKAKVVGTDPKTDVAVLKIDAKGLTPAKFGNSDNMQVGDWVLAIGSPFGLNQTVTAGIVSAKGRDHVGITDYEDFIQTDASINPGNSGGPLVDLRGEVIGINTAIASSTGRNAGVGFAIPSKMVQHVYRAIVQHGHVERGRIGAAIQDLTPNLAKSFGYARRERGVLVGDVIADGPAARAGLKSGDIIIAYNGRPLRSSAHLRNSIAATPPQSKATLRVFRKGRVQELAVTIGKLDEKSQPAVRGAEPDRGGFDDLGMTLQNITPEIARRLKLGATATGVVVTEVQPGSLASQVGIRPGDIIVSVGGDDVTDVAGYRKAMKSQTLSTGIRMAIKSEGLRRFVFLQQR